MDFGLSEEQQQLKESARAFLSGECPTTFVRQTMATDDGYPRELYAHIAQLGWSGLIVPEKFGGAGLGMLDMTMVLEEGGYAAMPGPFLFSSVLAASALKLGGSDQLNSKWLSALAEGKSIGTVAVVESAGSIDPSDINTIASKDGTGWRLNGVKMFVPYANVADFIVVAAKRDSDIRLFVVDTKSPGVTIRSLKNLDLTRRVSSVELRNAPAERLHGGGSALFEKLIDVAAVAVAADSLGSPSARSRWPSTTRKCANSSASRSARFKRSSTRPPKSSPTSSPRARCFGTPPTRRTPPPPTRRGPLRWRRRACAISIAAAPTARSSCTAESGSPGSTTCICGSSARASTSPTSARPRSIASA